MNRSRPVVLIVDAYHSSVQLVEELNRRNAACVHVRTGEAPATTMFAPLPDDAFRAVIDLEDDFELALQRLRRLSPVSVLPGSERGVEASDRLSGQLGLPGNGLEKSAARRDKHLMADAVMKCGLRTVRQRRCSGSSEAVEWARCEGLGRTVVKPLHGAGTDSVFICSGEDELKMRAASVLGSTHHLGLHNEHILVQEFIEGREYIVNTVSRDGIHRVTGVWLYHKYQVPGVTAIYDWDQLVDPDDPVIAELTNYAMGVLDALDVRFGPAHTEIMIDDQGPVLIECGARLDGLEYVPLARKCMGASQTEITCDAVLEPDTFQAGARTYSRLMHATNVLMITPKATTLHSTARLAGIRALPSFVHLLLRSGLGNDLPFTIDYQSAPGVIFLAHERAEQIGEDYRRIRQIEKDGLFGTPDQ